AAREGRGQAGEAERETTEREHVDGRTLLDRAERVRGALEHVDVVVERGLVGGGVIDRQVERGGRRQQGDEAACSEAPRERRDLAAARVHAVLHADDG